MKPLRFAAAASCVVLASFAVSAAPSERTVIVVEQPVELGEFTLGDPESLPLIGQTMQITIDGQHARTISNLQHKNVREGRVEGMTTLQLADTARVTAFSYWNGSERMLGEVLPRAIARQIYDETVGRRRDPGLLEQQGPGKFTLHIYPIEKRERKRMQIVWDEWLEQHDGAISYRAPLASARAEIVIDMSDDRKVSDLRSSSHRLDVSTNNGHTRVTARPKNDKVRELAMTWRVETPALTLHSWVHRDRGEDAYVLFHVAAPPASAGAKVPKDVTLVLDESGSMEGEPLENGKLAAASIVDRLDPEDRLNVVLFDDRVDTLFTEPKRVTAEVRTKARRFIDGAGNGGGTDVALALKAALTRQGKDARPKSILLITDGESPREPAFAAVQADENDVRLFTVGIGTQVDTPALQRLAQLKRGRYTAIEHASAIGSSMTKLYDRMQAPVLVGLALESEGPTLVRTYPATLPDLFAGDELVITARVQGGGELDVKLRGTTASGAKTLTHRTKVPAMTQRPWVGSMWAGARIDDLLTRLQLDSKDAAERVEEVTRLGVKYDIVTPYTSFLAIPEAELTANTRELLRRGRSGEADTQVRRMVDMEEFRGIPLGGSSRDFTSVVESAPTASMDEGDALSASGPRSGFRRDKASTRHARSAKGDADPSGTHGAGSAHCAVGSGADDSMWLVLLILLRRRWRRTRSGVPKA